MARDIAASFNHLYAREQALLVQPEFVVDDDVPLLPGLDGRKMSKSYDNTIPLFVPAEEMRKKIMGIVTDSRAPGEPKSIDGSAIFQLYQAFASADETRAFAKEFAAGIAWGAAKEKLFERINAEIAPMRARYAELLDAPQEVEAILQAGAAKARAVAQPLVQAARAAVGIRSLTAGMGAAGEAKKKTAAANFKQYREADGLFYFKLSAADGAVLLQSNGFANPREAAAVMATLKQDAAALDAQQAHIASMGERAAVAQALADLRQAA